MIISDEGRVSKMRDTARMLQRINYIPSQFNYASYQKEIKTLIEDPLPKNSKESIRFFPKPLKPPGRITAELTKAPRNEKVKIVDRPVGRTEPGNWYQLVSVS